MKLSANKIIIEWVPLHTLILGNENADKLANQALTLIAIQEDSGTAAFIIREIKESLYEEWIGDGRQGNSKLLKFGTEAGAVDSCHLPRKQQVAINQLRLGASMLSHGYIFKKSNPPSCTTCSTQITHSDVLVECPAFHTSRFRLQLTCQLLKLPLTRNITGCSFPREVLAKYLEETKLVQKI